MIQSIPLSKLVTNGTNPRRVKPERDAHQRLVASIKAFGLLEPLLVRPADGKAGRFQVIAGYRRLAALNEVHRGSKQDPKIPCEVRKVEDAEAEALSLSENFVREAMHPLDEAETFARLAGQEGKEAESIAAEFGVQARYIRQRMKLAALSPAVKAAYREGKIDTGTAEAFAAVPEVRQKAIWKELNGHPRHAEQVRRMIASSWIDASHALFDPASLPAESISKDLFADQVLIERAAFMQAQETELVKEKEKLAEEGWKEVVIAPLDQVQDRVWAMAEAQVQIDPESRKKLGRIEKELEKLSAEMAKLQEGDQAGEKRLRERMHALDAQAKEIWTAAPKHFAEEAKAIGTVFLILEADGQVRREYRIPRPKHPSSSNGNAGHAGDGQEALPPLPTSEDLSDAQLASTFAHHTLMVREALLANKPARKRILAMILHEKVRSEALAIRHEPNGVSLHASHVQDFKSAAYDHLQEKRKELDPFPDPGQVSDLEAYARLAKMPDSQLSALIDLLVVELVTAHALRRTELVFHLGQEFKVEFRKQWRPDAQWLSGYRKIQLAHLLGELYGPTYNAANETRKKSELVGVLEKLFVDAREGRLEEKGVVSRVNCWLPFKLVFITDVAGTQM